MRGAEGIYLRRVWVTSASTELEAVIELLGRLVLEPRTGVLILVLLVAAASDARTHRIPNWLVASGLIFALIYNGTGFSVAENYLSIPFLRENGWLISLQGMAVGFVLFFPLYLLRAMGAGDVKLAAMIGAFLGPWNTGMAVLSAFLAGGVLAIASMLWRGTALRALKNILLLTRASVLPVPAGVLSIQVHTSASAGTLPYAIAIAVGTIAYLVLKQLGIVAW